MSDSKSINEVVDESFRSEEDQTNDDLEKYSQEVNDDINRTKIIKKGFLHNDILLWSIRWIAFLSSACSVTLSGLSVTYFYRKDGKMVFVLILGCISFLYQGIILFDITSYFVKNIRRAISLRRFVVIFDSLLAALWFISFILVVIIYPRYECSIQGINNRTDGCRCGKASIGFSLSNFIVYLMGAIIFFFNILTRVDKNSNYVLKQHLLDFES